MFDELLVEDPRIAGGEAGHEDGSEPGELVLPLVGARRLLGLRELDQADPQHQQDQRHPLPADQPPLQQEDGEAGGGEDLELVGHLERGGVQVGQSQDQQVVLHGVETGGDGQTEGLPGSGQHLLPEGGEGGGEGALGDTQEPQAEAVLETLSEEDNSGGGVGLSLVVSPGVSEEYHCQGGLQYQDHQNHGPQVLA